MFSRKKKSEIPAVQPPADYRPGPPPSYRSGTGSVASGPGGYRPSPSPGPGGARPSGPGGYPSSGGSYNGGSYNNGGSYGGGSYSQGGYGRQPGPGYEAGRSELLKGARAPDPKFADRNLDEDIQAMREGRQQTQAQGDEDEEVEAIKQQMRFTKQESLSSTRNALRIAREAEETARGTLGRLGDQSDRIANTERQLDLAKAHASRAEDEAKEIVALNRSIFRPNFNLNKKAKRDAEELRIISRHVDEKEEREETRKAQLESRNRTEGALRQLDRERADRNNAGPSAGGLKSRLAERSRYQFENTASDDELEDELDSNLDEIQAMTGRLKVLGQTMGTEIDSQNKKLDVITGKTDRLDTKIYGQTQRLARIK